MAHHRNTVQRWLSIEESTITIPEMTLHDIPRFQFLEEFFFCFIRYPLSSPIRTTNIVGTRILVGTTLYHFLQVCLVPCSNAFRNRELHRNLAWDSYLIDLNHTI